MNKKYAKGLFLNMYKMQTIEKKVKISQYDASINLLHLEATN